MKLLTTSMIDESKYKSLGLVQGLSVRSLNAFRQFFGNIKAMFGQRQGGFEKIFIQARQEAIQEMTRNAERLGADEVIGINLGVSELSAGSGSDGYIVFIADGTAVAKKDKDLSSKKSKQRRLSGGHLASQKRKLSKRVSSGNRRSSSGNMRSLRQSTYKKKGGSRSKKSRTQKK